MKQTMEEDGLLFTYAVHDDPEKSLNNKEEKHVHYFHIPKVRDNSEHLLGSAPETRIVSNVSGFDLSAQVLQRYDIIAGIDTEYQEITKGEHTPASYQFSAFYHHEGVWEYTERVLDPSQKITLGQYLHAILTAFGLGRRRAEGMKVLLIAHISRAEWHMLKDRTAIAEQCKVIHRVPVTIKPLKWSVPFGSKNYSQVLVELRDTCLPAPTPNTALAALAKDTPFPKIELPKGAITRMCEYRHEDPTTFESYAITDCRGALAYYLRFMADYEAIAGTRDVLPLTVGHGTVEAYVHQQTQAGLDILDLVGKVEVQDTNSKGYKTHRLQMKPSLAVCKTFGVESYMGGLNNIYVIGERTGKILDLDFSGAYLAALGVIPQINWDACPYQTQRITNTLFDGPAVNMIIAHVAFQFPETCLYPNLAMRRMGSLFFPLQGETYCTLPEIVLARHLGAQVQVNTAFHFPLAYAATGKPVLMFADYLAKLARLRQDEPKAGRKGQPREQLLKLMANSFYGKLGQGLSGKMSRSTRSGEMAPMNEAKVTCPPYAAMCTGIVRAALASVVYELSQHEGFEVLSATTDGCMVQVPDTFAFSDIDEGGIIHGLRFDELYPSVYKNLCDYPTIQLLMQGRRNTDTDPHEWMEVKHAGSWAYTYKTRIYGLEHEGVTQHIATAGMHLDKREVSTLHAYHQTEGIPTFTATHLPSVHEILDGKYPDMINVHQKRRVNTDFDYKRIPLPGTLGLTRPPTTLSEALAAKEIARELRHKGIRAEPERVARGTLKIKSRGGMGASTERIVMCAILRNVANSKPKGVTLKGFATAWDKPEGTIRRWASQQFQYPNSIWDTSENRARIDEVCRQVGIEPPPEFLRIILTSAPEPPSGP